MSELLGNHNKTILEATNEVFGPDSAIAEHFEILEDAGFDIILCKNSHESIGEYIDCHVVGSGYDNLEKIKTEIETINTLLFSIEDDLVLEKCLTLDFKHKEDSRDDSDQDAYTDVVTNNLLLGQSKMPGLLVKPLMGRLVKNTSKGEACVDIHYINSSAEAIAFIRDTNDDNSNDILYSSESINNPKNEDIIAGINHIESNGELASVVTSYTICLFLMHLLVLQSNLSRIYDLEEKQLSLKELRLSKGAGVLGVDHENVVDEDNIYNTNHTNY